MSKYTTGEIAKLCGVTVRTVQYYDARGILVPTELSEGGRRLYAEDDLKRLRIICFLRELGLPIDVIAQILAEDEPKKLIALLLEQQAESLREEIGERREKLDKLESLQRELKSLSSVSVESIGDIAFKMTNKKQLKKVYRMILLTALPVSAIEIAAIILGVTKGLWWLLAVWAVVAIPWGIWISRYYYRNVAYICPQCHTVFRPSFREMMFANHTPTTRKLTCTACGHRGFCVEVAAEQEEKSQQ